ncbi:MAG: tRNA (adenine(22)-N(1))-methyltransferase TrmK, partial [Kangiellaceae bacterium]|nr:tRNA (adenine(22)-N(1))-methyltransferase TrmK [Kangiellaceae bacterium]
MKIGARLSKIDSTITKHYDCIWDCCCDHGFLGMTLLKRNAATRVYFNDIVPSITDELEINLNKYFPRDPRWSVTCSNASDILLAENQTHLVTLAGIGGDRFIEIMQGITTNNPHLSFDVIACTVHHNYRVRTYLANLGYKLIGESLIKENKRFYEIIYASKSAANPISNVGESIWQKNKLLAEEYLAENLNFFSNKVK